LKDLTQKEFDWLCREMVRSENKMLKGLTQEKFDWLRRLESEVDKSWDELTGSEQGFIEDVLEKFRHWGTGLMLSAKQWDVITRISEKII